MATIVTRSGKGSPLTHAEVDANFENLNSDKAEVSSLGTAAAADTTDFVSQTSTTGAAAIPSGTEAQRPSPAAGQLRFNTEAGSFEGYDGAEWGAIGGGGGGAVDDLFYENAQTVAANYTLGATRNAMTTGPISINSGVAVTVSSGARWVIL